MDKQIILKAINGNLVLKVTNKLEWCSVFFDSQDGFKKLGSDSKKIILGKLLFALNPNKFLKSDATVINGLNCFFFMALSEDHTDCFVMKDNDDLRMIFRSDDGNVIGSLCISNRNCKAWKTKLTQF